MTKLKKLFFLFKYANIIFAKQHFCILSQRHFISFFIALFLFVASSLTTQAAAASTVTGKVPPKFSQVDPKGLIPRNMLIQALEYFETHRSEIKNDNYIGIIDYAKSSLEKRFYILNLMTGNVLAIHTAHGKGSDPKHINFASRFSDKLGSNASSLGFFITGETYFGTHGLSLKLNGISATNRNANDRGIVIHAANYVSEQNNFQGRSLGCPALAPEIAPKVIHLLKGGSLIFAAYDAEKMNAAVNVF